MPTTSTQHPAISVIMPTYNQASFIRRAINSLKNQTFKNWQLVIINDGCTDDTQHEVESFLPDERIIVLTNKQNTGLGHCLNQGLKHAKAGLIAYLPSDDVYFRDHLATLYAVLNENPNCNFAYSGMRSKPHEAMMSDFSEITFLPEKYFQLVQVLHVKTPHRWLERTELVTDDLGKMFWDKIYTPARSVCTGLITCEWVTHAAQTHKLIMEYFSGGIYAYKKHFNIGYPIKFQSSVGNLIDEQELYKAHQNPAPEYQQGSLKILLVGELAYNPERIIALEEAGHMLYGLWIHSPESYNAVGPLPFGNIIDIPIDNWEARVNEIRPDIIYALLNTQAIPLAHHVLRAGLSIPFVWHFKEGPFFAMQADVWEELMYLYRHADGLIFINEETQGWFSQFLNLTQPALILDGDLPSKKWFTEQKNPLLSAVDNELHTVVPGRPVGIHARELDSLKNQRIHLHFYGEYYHSTWRDWVLMAQEIANGYIHLHPFCQPAEWVNELSKYDAGWLHTFDSDNFGDITRVTWNDLNYPARMNTLAAAGLPMIQKCNEEHLVATQNLTGSLGTGIFYKDFDSLSDALNNQNHLQTARQMAWANRFEFCFDHHVPRLTGFFHEVIARYRNSKKQGQAIVINKTLVN